MLAKITHWEETKISIVFLYIYNRDRKNLDSSQMKKTPELILAFNDNIIHFNQNGKRTRVFFRENQLAAFLLTTMRSRLDRIFIKFRSLFSQNWIIGKQSLWKWQKIICSVRHGNWYPSVSLRLLFNCNRLEWVIHFSFPSFFLSPIFFFFSPLRYTQFSLLSPVFFSITGL